MAHAKLFKHMCHIHNSSLFSYMHDSDYNIELAMSTLGVMNGIYPSQCKHTLTYTYIT